MKLEKEKQIVTKEDIGTVKEILDKEVLDICSGVPIVPPVYLTAEEKRTIVDVLNVCGNGKYIGIIQKLR